MKKIICRWAPDDMEALYTARGMENAGAEVFSITYNGVSSKWGNGHHAPHEVPRFLVWAKVPEGITFDDIDEVIEIERSKSYPPQK